MAPTTLLWTAGTVVVLTARLFFLIRHLVRRGEAASRAALDGWADARLAECLAGKLREPAEVILRAVRGASGGDLAAAARAAVHSASLTFTRPRGSHQVGVRLEVVFTDGSSSAVAAERSWDELPTAIRDEFLRSGSEAIIRPWEFPRGTRPAD
jgi:hypothetical protein